MAKYGITTDPTWELDCSDATNQPADDALVSSYAPTVGSGNATNAGGSQCPTFKLDIGDGMAGILFAGANQTLSVDLGFDSSWDAGFTWFVVTREAATVAAHVTTFTTLIQSYKSGGASTSLISFPNGGLGKHKRRWVYLHPPQTQRPEYVRGTGQLLGL
jgi:hypothetical protein